MDLADQLFHAVDQHAVPRDESRAGVYVDAVKMRIFVDVLLLVPVGDTVRIKLGGIEL